MKPIKWSTIYLHNTQKLPLSGLVVVHLAGPWSSLPSTICINIKSTRDHTPPNCLRDEHGRQRPRSVVVDCGGVHSRWVYPLGTRLHVLHWILNEIIHFKNNNNNRRINSPPNHNWTYFITAATDTPPPPTPLCTIHMTRSDPLMRKQLCENRLYRNWIMVVLWFSSYTLLLNRVRGALLADTSNLHVPRGVVVGYDKKWSIYSIHTRYLKL